jgi:hypothetical protein
MTTCSRCGRPLKHATPHGMGPKCAQAVLGTKPRARARVTDGVGRGKPDERQQELFAEVRT